ncbi:MAG: prolyl oligopeptidase family serine peptidase [Burkholderiales bacterium]|nr:prolyl oligopeptidase family serine peptidase [Burkholderiales bacterium]
MNRSGYATWMLPMLVVVIGCSGSQSTLAQDSAAQTSFRERMRARMAQQESKGRTHEAINPSGKITQPGDYRFTLEHGGLERMYLVHVPAKYRPGHPAPLLVSLHGGGGSMNYMASDENYGQISKSDREGFIVVFPNGISRLKNGLMATWNAGTCCGAARDRNIDDVGFIRKMIDKLSRQLDIDRQKIFATGMSNGGLMALRLACEMSDTFKAVASVAGTDNTTSCSPANPVSVLFIHARNDDHVPFEGGRGKGRHQEAVTSFTSVPESVSRWVKRDDCSVTSKRVLDKPGAYCERYAPCRDNAQVELCVTDSGAHSWPGAAKWRSIEPPSTAINANDVMWDFFMQR